MIYSMHSIHLSFDRSGTAARRIAARALNLPEAVRAVNLKTRGHRTLASEKFRNVRAVSQNGSTPH
ncbi:MULTISPECIES: hypothetical protein [Burkholderia]|uniref:hypothetical protein n=1 Tax=Burkholderia TaxID=32008 RepID=UPI000841C286|nr:MULTISPECIES: hypothetical protein [unclassified Burkholderia]AOK31517.1 hypothetical protein AQ611_18275 [Burkholderia sp. Bp7605]